MHPLTLHHIGHAVPSIPEAAARYTETLGYTLSTPILHDPIQTALVQFLRLQGDSAWLELVAPDGPESKLALTARKRPGLHHLCYTCGPLAATLDHLSAQGMLLFSDPQPAIAFDGRRICWLTGQNSPLIELIERRHPEDPCTPNS